MRSCKFICEQCKKEVNTGSYPNLPSGWKSVKIELGQYDYKNFDLCPECLLDLGLVSKDTGKIGSIEEPTIKDKIFDLIYEIANQAIDDRGL